MIEARDLHKRFDTCDAVRGVSFTAPDGAVTGLLGPNGAGKSTTLRMLYGLIAPTQGSSFIDGHCMQEDPVTARARLGVLPDSLGHYARLTARENIRYFAELHGLRGRALSERVEVTAAALDMHRLLDRRTEGFSQGERTKVALARALVHDPHNIILDEPTHGLDVTAVRGLRDLVRDLRDRGHCVLLSSHSMHEVAALCDHLVVLVDGRILVAGTPEDLRSRAGVPDLEEAFVRLVERA